MVRLGRHLELHLVHLELLSNGHRVRAVEACPAELLGGAPPDRPHEPLDGQVLKTVRADALANLCDGSTGCDQLLGGTDVDPHKAREAHRRACLLYTSPSP